MDLVQSIIVDGIARPRINAEGKAIAPTDEGLIRFWRWFQHSRTVDAAGRPLVVYHGTNAMAYSGGKQIETFHTHHRGGAFFSTSKVVAKEYGEALYAVYIKLDAPLVVHAAGAAWCAIETDARIQAAVTDAVRTEKTQVRHQTDALLAALFDDDEDHAVSHTPQVTLDKLSDLPGLGDATVETDTIAKAARRLGYAGVIIYDVKDSPTSDVRYSKRLSTIVVSNKPENIKCIDNPGDWGANEPCFHGAVSNDPSSY